MVATALALGVTVAVLAAMTALGVAHSRTRMLSVEDYISARNSADTGTTAATLIASGILLVMLAREARAETDSAAGAEVNP